MVGVEREIGGDVRGDKDSRAACRVGQLAVELSLKQFLRFVVAHSFRNTRSHFVGEYGSADHGGHQMVDIYGVRFDIEVEFVGRAVARSQCASEIMDGAVQREIAVVYAEFGLREHYGVGREGQVKSCQCVA